MASVRDKLTRQELCAEAIIELLRRGMMSKELFCARMTALDNCGPQGQIAACYATWLILSRHPPSEERDAHMERNTLKLRRALEEAERVP